MLIHVLNDLKRGYIDSKDRYLIQRSQQHQTFLYVHMRQNVTFSRLELCNLPDLLDCLDQVITELLFQAHFDSGCLNYGKCSQLMI